MSRVHEVVLAERRIEEVQLRIKEQKVRLQRTIVQGFPSQSDDDLLTRLYVNLDKLQQGRRTKRLSARFNGREYCTFFPAHSLHQ